MSPKYNKFLNHISNKDIFLILLIIFALIIVYYPSISYEFLYTDDYLYFFPKINDPRYEGYLSSSASSLWDYSVALGRPSLFYFILSGNNLITNIADAAIFRVFALLGLTLFSIMTYLWLRMHNKSSLISFLIVILIISSPSMVLAISWVTLHNALYSMLLAVIAIFLVEKGLQSNSWIYFVTSFLIMFISLNGYSPYSMIFWCFVLIKVANKSSLDLNDYKSKIFPFFIVGLSSMACYFIVGKQILEFGGYLEGNPLKKIYWLITEVIPYSLSFNTLFPNFFIATITLVVIFYGFFQGYINIYRENNALTFDNLLVKVEFLKTSVILALLFLSFSPIILSSYGVNSHRILLVLKASLIVMFFYGLEKIIQNSKLKPLVIALSLAVLTPFVIYYGHSINKNYIVIPQYKEYLHLKNEIDLNLTGDMKYIHMYRPPHWTGDVPYTLPKGFDIGTFSSGIESNAKNMIISALNDLQFRDQFIEKGEIFNKKYIISSSVKSSQGLSDYDGIGETVPNQNVLIIDMSEYMKTFTLSSNSLKK